MSTRQPRDRPDVDLRPAPADLRPAVFDALPDSAAIVDSVGVITHVNSTWVTFAQLNQGSPSRTGRGANYLRACEQAASNGDEDAAAVAEGLDGVLASRLRFFEHRYPCPSQLEDRWFVARITPLDGGQAALVVHLDVTAVKLTQDRLVHGATHDQLTGLPNREGACPSSGPRWPGSTGPGRRWRCCSSTSTASSR